MRPGISPALVLLAFLAGLWGCQEQGRTKLPEGRITKPTHLHRSDAVIRKVTLGTGPVRADQDRLYQDRLRQGLAAAFMARGIGEQEAQALARGALPQGKSLEDIYPPDDVPLWGKTPEGLKAQIRKDFQDSGIPRELVEAEINALANQPFSLPQSPKGR
jgi:hypothetical protein